MPETFTLQRKVHPCIFFYFFFHFNKKHLHL